MSEILDYKQWEQGRETYMYLQGMGYFVGYEIIGSDDVKECDLCDKKQGEYAKLTPNTPLSPFHPNCRCRVILHWKKSVNPELIYREFYNTKTGEIHKNRWGYAPTIDLILEAVNYFLRKKHNDATNLDWKDLLEIGFVDTNGTTYTGETYNAEFLVGKKIDTEKLDEIYEEKQEAQKHFEEILIYLKKLLVNNPCYQTLVNLLQKAQDQVIEWHKLVPYYQILARLEGLPEDSLQTAEICGRQVTLQKKALESLVLISIEMILDGEENGIEVGSSYRSYDDQVIIIEEAALKYGWYDLPKEAQNKAWDDRYYEDYQQYDEELFKKWRWLDRKISKKDRFFPVAPPGESNHQNGLAVDLKYDHNYINDKKHYLENNGWKQLTDDPVHFDYIEK